MRSRTRSPRAAARSRSARRIHSSARSWASADISAEKPSIYIIHDERRYVQPLIAELTKRGTPFIEWNLESEKSKHLLDISAVPPYGVFYNRISGCGCSKHRDIPQLARGILMWLQNHRRRIVNGTESISMVASKLEAQIAMQLSGITTPRSLAALNESQILDAARSVHGKFLLEPNRRELGKGVVAFNTVAELEAFLKTDNLVPSADNITVVQEYVKSRAPYVNRVEFVGKQLLYGMHVDVSRGLERLVPGYSTDPTYRTGSKDKEDTTLTPVPRYQVLPEFDHPILDSYTAFMSKHNLEIASFEFVEDADGNTITFDMDICSTFNSPAEYRAQVPKAGVQAIADYLTRLLELERPIRKNSQKNQTSTSQLSSAQLYDQVSSTWKDIIVCDGGMGRELKKRLPDCINAKIWSAQAIIDSPDAIKACHVDFIKSGARVIIASNYACTPNFLSNGGLQDRFEELIAKAVILAAESRDEAGVKGVKVAGSVPPLTESYRADLVGSIEEMLPVYDKIAAAMAPHVDIFLCETMSKPSEAYAAAKACSKYNKPVWVSWTLRDDLSGLLRSGDTVQDAYDALREVPVEAFMFNCCVPEAIEVALPILLRLTDKPVGAMPNCFAPLPTDWTLSGMHGFRETREDMTPLDFVGYVRGWVDKGARIVGGCCGIGPEHMSLAVNDIQDIDDCKCVLTPSPERTVADRNATESS